MPDLTSTSLFYTNFNKYDISEFIIKTFLKRSVFFIVCRVAGLLRVYKKSNSHHFETGSGFFSNLISGRLVERLTLKLNFEKCHQN